MPIPRVSAAPALRSVLPDRGGSVVGTVRHGSQGKRLVLFLQLDFDSVSAGPWSVLTVSPGQPSHSLGPVGSDGYIRPALPACSHECRCARRVDRVWDQHTAARHPREVKGLPDRLQPRQKAGFHPQKPESVAGGTGRWPTGSVFALDGPRLRAFVCPAGAGPDASQR
jgi:hypothetical protein